MKSSSPSTSKRGSRRLIKYSELGIPVFLIGFGISDSLRLLAPDFINWVELFNQQPRGEITPVESYPSKHTGNAIMGDLGNTPGPA